MWKDLRRAIGFVSFASMYLTGMTAIVLVASFGPHVAQGLRFVLEQDIEAQLVTEPFPWIPVIAFTVLPWPIFTSGRHRWALFATIPMVVLPLAHFVRLYQMSA